MTTSAERAVVESPKVLSAFLGRGELRPSKTTRGSLDDRSRRMAVATVLKNSLVLFDLDCRVMSCQCSIFRRNFR
jgi:hypothetical protein